MRPLGSKANARRITPPITFSFVYQTTTRFMNLSLQINTQLMVCQPLRIILRKAIEKKQTKSKSKAFWLKSDFLSAFSFAFLSFSFFFAFFSKVRFLICFFFRFFLKRQIFRLKLDLADTKVTVAMLSVSFQDCPLNVWTLEAGCVVFSCRAPFQGHLWHLCLWCCAAYCCCAAPVLPGLFGLTMACCGILPITWITFGMAQRNLTRCMLAIFLARRVVKQNDFARRHCAWSGFFLLVVSCEFLETSWDMIFLDPFPQEGRSFDWNVWNWLIWNKVNELHEPLSSFHLSQTGAIYLWDSECPSPLVSWERNRGRATPLLQIGKVQIVELGWTEVQASERLAFLHVWSPTSEAWSVLPGAGRQSLHWFPCSSDQIGGLHDGNHIHSLLLRQGQSSNPQGGYLLWCWLWWTHGTRETTSTWRILLETTTVATQGGRASSNFTCYFPLPFNKKV